MRIEHMKFRILKSVLNKKWAIFNKKLQKQLARNKVKNTNIQTF